MKEGIKIYEILFFDIECCNGRNICEFGYVITDEKSVIRLL